jgi:tetratricopeptide (TPR) repeat protein
MTTQDEKLVRLRRQRSKQAIDLAMQGRWREAVAANEVIVESFPTDVDAYNRLGRAYMELGEYAQAKNAYKRALKYDPHNAIAKKNLQRLNYLGETAVSTEGEFRKVEPQQFIEEVGKAGVVNLYGLGRKEVRARLVAGDKVNLRIDNHNLVVEDGRGDFLGIVEPRHALRLIKLMEAGNKYSASVVSAVEEAMTIIIRETSQHPGQVGKLSFPTRLEEFKPVEERVFKMEAEMEELPEESGYTIVGGEEGEVLPEEAQMADEMINEED